MLDHHWPASEKPFKWRFAGGPMVDILTFISMIDTPSEKLKARNCFNCRDFSFYERLKFRAQLS